MLNTRIEPDLIGYNGINFYNDKDEYVGCLSFFTSVNDDIIYYFNVVGFNDIPFEIEGICSDLSGFTVYDDNINSVGTVKYRKKSKKNKVEVFIEIKGIKAIPKAIDERD